MSSTETRNNGTRVPPNDLRAEAALLGAMLLSGQAIADVIDLCTAEDFYQPSHAHIFDVVTWLYRSGEPADAVTVADRLRAMDLLENVGGPAALSTLQTNTPAISNAVRYARLVAEHAAKRRLAAAAVEAGNLAYDLSKTAEEALEASQGLLAAIVTPTVRMPPGVHAIDDYVYDPPHEARRPWLVPGLLRYGWRVMMVAGEGQGKALHVETPVPTLDGWATMGTLEIGDRVFADTGEPVRVLAVTEMMHDRPCYRVTFSDETSIIADAEHLWQTVTYGDRQPGRWEPGLRTTETLAGSVHARDGFVLNHVVPVSEPIDPPEIDLPIDPYTLGVWLGDGTTSGAVLTLFDDDAPEILARIESAGYVIRPRKRNLEEGRSRGYGIGGLHRDLRLNGLMGDKHIPPAYLRASFKQRLALLQGLMDTDGYIPDASGTGRGTGAPGCELTLCRESLADGAYEVILSLGIKARSKVSAAKLNGRIVNARWRMTFQSDLPVFSVGRKATRIVAPMRTRRPKNRYVVSVEPVPSVPVRCIQVEGTGMFLAGEHFVPTHNSTLTRQLAICAAQGIHPLAFSTITPVRTLIVDLENPPDPIYETCKMITDRARSAKGAEYEPGRAWLWTMPGGINIRTRTDRARLDAVIASVRPDLVCLGPLYQTFRRGRDSDEEAAVEAAQVLDVLRTRYDFALVIEHHAPKAQDNRRDLNPFGSSVWLRWPELGLKLKAPGKGDPEDSLVVGRFRKDRVKCNWPDRLDRGTTGWAWEGRWSGPYGVEEPQPVLSEEF